MNRMFADYIHENIDMIVLYTSFYVVCGHAGLKSIRLNAKMTVNAEIHRLLTAPTVHRVISFPHQGGLCIEDPM